MGACTIANRTVGVTVNGMRFVECDLTPSASYATNGDTVAGLGLADFRDLTMVCGALDGRGVAVTPRGYQVILAGTKSAPKVKVFNGSASEVANATDLSGAGAVRVRFIGYA